HQNPSSLTPHSSLLSAPSSRHRTTLHSTPAPARSGAQGPPATAGAAGARGAAGAWARGCGPRPRLPSPAPSPPASAPRAAPPPLGRAEALGARVAPPTGDGVYWWSEPPPPSPQSQPAGRISHAPRPRRPRRRGADAHGGAQLLVRVASKLATSSPAKHPSSLEHGKPLGLSSMAKRVDMPEMRRWCFLVKEGAGATGSGCLGGICRARNSSPFCTRLSPRWPTTTQLPAMWSGGGHWWGVVASRWRPTSLTHGIYAHEPPDSSGRCSSGMISQ
ncbi:unnamed protein product, partial [Urochloa humidicola]